MTDRPAPAVSVCIPVFNCERFVAGAIESVLAQTFTDFELIVVDNASTDRTLEIVRGFDDPRVRVVRNEHNLGAAGNWNKALRLARGQYVKLVCADDYLYPSCLARQVEIFRQASSAAVLLVACSRDIVDDQGKRFLTRRFPGRRGQYAGHKLIRKNIRHGTNILGEPASVLMRADVLHTIGGFDDSIPYVLDLDLYCRLLLNGDAYLQTEPLCAFRVSQDSWSVTLAKKQAENFCEYIERLRADPRFRITRVDVVLGRAMARLNAGLRQIAYRRMNSK
jgi:glycosyltransferase involved in cell wall biosynthesis